MKQKYMMPKCSVCKVEPIQMIATSLNVDQEKGDNMVGDVNLNPSFTDIWGNNL